MINCFDVAKYILEEIGQITSMKLQKLVYYSQAWSLVWDENPLFNEKIEAWINGPVIPELYKSHAGKFKVQKEDFPNGDSSKLTSNQKDTISKVLNYYGKMEPQWLSDLSHLEDPWKNARESLSPNVRGSAEITLAAMNEYYCYQKHGQP